ncbi:MAG: alpha-1,2-fucosyltransferase [Candidatus Nomurabacteria bacterium]
MKIVKIFGGLGNQLFQYSFALYLKNEFKDEIIKIDNGVNTNKKDILRKYALDNFNISLDMASEKEIKKIKYPLSFFSKVYLLIETKILRKFNIGYENWVLDKKNYYYSGFWQSFKYLEPVKDQIKKEIFLKESINEKYKDLINDIENTNSISIHIRRGDYILDHNTRLAHYTFGLEYYEKAMKIIEDRKSNILYLIFSDDIEWARDNLKINKNKIFVSSSELKDYEELILMSKCKDNIIANSTFSYWAAWLNTNKEKIVIAPKKWNNIYQDCYKNLIPKDWLVI